MWNLACWAQLAPASTVVRAGRGAGASPASDVSPLLAGDTSHPPAQIIAFLRWRVAYVARQRRRRSAGGCLVSPTSTMPNISILTTSQPAFRWSFAEEELRKSSKNTK
jgi:hypothetical protein